MLCGSALISLMQMAVAISLQKSYAPCSWYCVGGSVCSRVAGIGTTRCQHLLQALGDHVSLEAVAKVLDTIKHRGSDGIGFPDFVAIMTSDRLDAEDGQRRGKADVTTAYNIAIMARAYRRVRPFPACTLILGSPEHCSRPCCLLVSQCGSSEVMHLS